MQALAITKALVRQSDKWTAATSSSSSRLPIVWCGDFNVTPIDGTYHFIMDGHLPRDHVEAQAMRRIGMDLLSSAIMDVQEGSPAGEDDDDGDVVMTTPPAGESSSAPVVTASTSSSPAAGAISMQHAFTLDSAYRVVLEEEPKYTNYTAGFKVLISLSSAKYVDIQYILTTSAPLVRTVWITCSTPHNLSDRWLC